MSTRPSPLSTGGSETPDDEKALKWGTEQRMAFIEFRLYWEGHVNRTNLTEMFGISEPQATADFSKYQELAPGNIQYDPTVRAYVPTPQFTPKYSPARANEYLAHLRLIDDQIEPETPNWIGKLPNWELAPILRRRLQPDTLREVVDASIHKRVVSIKYRSFTNPEPHWRKISPHAIVFDGRRWHVRAWCHKDNDFRDFVFARIDETKKEHPSSVDPAFDLFWQEYVELELCPNPFLTPEQQEILKIEYQMKGGCLRFKTRASMYFYMREYFFLNIKPTKSNAMSVHLCLRNEEQVDTALSALKTKSREALKGCNFHTE